MEAGSRRVVREGLGELRMGCSLSGRMDLYGSQGRV